MMMKRRAINQRPNPAATIVESAPQIIFVRPPAAKERVLSRTDHYSPKTCLRKARRKRAGGRCLTDGGRKIPPTARPAARSGGGASGRTRRPRTEHGRARR